jgi:hypothetical protein
VPRPASRRRTATERLLTPHPTTIASTRANHTSPSASLTSTDTMYAWLSDPASPPVIKTKRTRSPLEAIPGACRVYGSSGTVFRLVKVVLGRGNL